MNGIISTWNLVSNAIQNVCVGDKDGGTIVTLSVCNKRNESIIFSAGITSGSNDISEEEYIEYNVEIPGNGVLERTGIALAAGQYLTVVSNKDYVNVVCWGTSYGNDAVVPDIVNNLGNAYSGYVSSMQIDPPASYTITSGSLPTGLSLNGSGLITGTVTGTYAPGSTTSLFTATDGVTPRTFSIIRKWSDGSTPELAAPSASYIKTLTGTTTSGSYWIKHPSGYTSVYQTYCDMSTLSGGWMLAWVVTNANGDTQYWFDNDSSMSSPANTPNWFTVNETRNLQMEYGTNVSVKENIRMPAFTSYAFTQMMIRENFNGSIRFKGYTLNTTQSFLQWFTNTAIHDAYTDRVSAIIGTSGDTMTTGSSAFSSNTLDFNYGLTQGATTNDGARLASTPVVLEATGGISARVDGGRNYIWKGNVTRDDAGRIYSTDGTTTDHTIYFFVK